MGAKAARNFWWFKAVTFEAYTAGALQWDQTAPDLMWCLKISAYDYDEVSSWEATSECRCFQQIAKQDQTGSTRTRQDYQTGPRDRTFLVTSLCLRHFQNHLWQQRRLPDLSKKMQLFQTARSNQRTDRRGINRQRLRPYRRRAVELAIHRGCIIWGSQVIIPTAA